MPSADLYRDTADGQLLLDRLNSDTEVAFVLEEEAAILRLVASLPSLPSGDYVLFHKSYTSIPMYEPPSEEIKAASELIYSLIGMDLPEFLSGADQGHPSIFRVHICYTQCVADQKAIGLSHLSWIGNRYTSLGKTATPESKRWWRRFNAWIARTARKVSRSGPLDDYPKNFRAWAFPSALASIKAGVGRAAHPPF